MGSNRHVRGIAVVPDHPHSDPTAPHRRELRSTDHGNLRGHRNRRGDRRRGPVRQLALRIAALAIAATALLGVLTACGGSSSDSADNSAAPVKLQTFTRAGIELPRTKDDGPETTTPFPRGYAQTRTGAALAAVNTTVVLDTATDDQWGQVLSALVENNAAYQEWRAARQQVSIKPRSASTATVTIDGFRVISYSDTAADVEVYSTYPDGSHAKLDRHVRWAGTDWKVVLPDEKSGAVVTSVDDFPKDMVKV